LSPEQLGFIERQHAYAGSLSANEDGSVFVYRDGERGTDRWLVHRCGSVLESERFRKCSEAKDRDRR
jgi:hypothetical protein